jgi:hypothetical protein
MQRLLLSFGRSPRLSKPSRYMRLPDSPRVSAALRVDEYRSIALYQRTLPLIDALIQPLLRASD